MTQEQLQKGKQIENILKEYRDHKEHVLNRWKNSPELKLDAGSYASMRLQSFFMPMPFKEYIELYTYNIDCSIRRLEQELKNL